MTFRKKKTYNLKILTLFVAISSILAISVLIMGYYQETKFEQITANSYANKYETLFLRMANNSINELYKNTVNYTRHAGDKLYTQKADYVLFFKNSKFLYGISKKKKKIVNNPLGFIPSHTESGVVKLKNGLYLYSSYEKNKNTKKIVVLLRSFSSLPNLNIIGRIIPKSEALDCKVEKRGYLYAGLCSKNKKGYILIADPFKKPIATVVISPEISDIFTAHYKAIFQILIFTVMAIIISALFSYLIIKKAVLDSIDKVISSIKNVKHDLTYIKPKLKDRQFQLLADTVEWLTTKVKEGEYMFDKIANLIPMGIIVYRNVPIYANSFAVRFFKQDIVGKPIINLVNEKYRKMLSNIKKQRVKGKNFHASYTVEIDKPENRVIRTTSTTIQYKGEPAGLMAFIDITKNERLKRLYKIMNSVSDIIIKSENEKDMLKKICTALTSYSSIKAAWVAEGNTRNILFSSGQFDNIRKILMQSSSVQTSNIVYTTNTNNFPAAVLPIHIKKSNDYFIGIYSNIKDFFDSNAKSIMHQIKINIELAAAHIHTQQEKMHMFFYDSLTVLKNFNSLKKDITDVSSCVLIYINIKGFSVINQIYGFEFSDKILKRMGILLRKNVKYIDNVYRLHGDKFAVLIKQEIRKKNVENLILRLQKRLEEFELDSRKIPIHTDIGVTMFPSLTNKTDKIIKSVESALTKSKEINKVCFYSYDMQREIEENFKLESYIRMAIEKRLFFFFYQPILNIKNGRIEKAEALIRLKDENGRLISPEKFISIAEKVNIISDLTQIVIEDVFKEIAKLENINISINLSSKDIENPRIMTLIKENLKKYGIKPKTISVELTERDIMHNFQSTKLFIEKLRKSNIEIEMDDFGIGYSSFDRIVDLDFDVLKIDKSLVDLIGTNRKAEQTIIYIIRLAHSLNAKALAEGIETKEQFLLLSQNSCDYIQGYYISKPLPFNEFVEFISKV